ncbi:MAG: 5'-nucleotidase C-terminal domain-containing protein [Alkalilacustris sp.]
MPSRPQDAGELSLRLLATSDLHMSLIDFDYRTDAPARPARAPGLSGVAGCLAQLRAGADASLLFDCGDFLQGGPMGDFLGAPGGLQPGAEHPMIAAMNQLGYDAVTLGNHDFSYGLDFLQRVLGDARFRVVSSNLSRRCPDTGGRGPPLVTPHAVVPVTLRADLPPLRVGLLGLAPPQLLDWEEAQLQGRLDCAGMVEAARARIPALRAEGADLVLALVHGGIAHDGAPNAAEHPARQLACLPGLDVLLLGHAHDVFPGPRFEGLADVDLRAGRIGGRPAVMPGMLGSHLGVIDLGLRHEAGGWRWRCRAVRALPVAAPPRQPGPEVQRIARLIAPVHAATRAHVAQPVGRTPVRLHSWFAQLADAAALRLLGEAHCAWARKAVAGTAHEDWPILAAVAPLRAGGRGGPGEYTDIPPGPVLLRHVHDLLPFPDALKILPTTGAGIADWLERTAGHYLRQRAGGRDRPLVHPDAPPYAFDVIHGVDYSLDLGARSRYRPDGRRREGPGGRVRDLRLNGRPLAPDRPVLLVANSYRAAGGGGFPGTGPGVHALPVRGDARAAVVAHLRCAATDVPAGALARPDAGWRLTAPPGTRVRFATAPAAAAHLAEIAGLTPEMLGPTPEGFLMLRLRF